MALGSKSGVVPEYDFVQECDHKGTSLLCKLNGWKILPEDVQHYSSFLPPAAVVARSSGRPVGTCIGVPWNDREAVIILLVVDEAVRGRGVGTRLMQKSLAAMGDRNISVFSTPEGIAIYKKFGFSTGENPTGIHQSKFKPKTDAFEGASPREHRIVPLSEVNFQELVDYDTDTHRFRRERKIKQLLHQPDSVAIINETDHIVGYVGIWHYPDEKYIQLTPLHADTLSLATMLLKHVMQVIPEGYQIKVKVPLENPEAISLMEKIGFSTNLNPPDILMFNKHKFQVKMHKVYSVMDGWNQFA